MAFAHGYHTRGSVIHDALVQCCSVLQCVVVCCSVLQCVAVCCSVLQCVVVCCSVFAFVWRVYYGVATISRMLKNIYLFAEYRSLLWVSFAKETYIFKHPTNRSHPIAGF
jgi:hypothetical protein